MNFDDLDFDDELETEFTELSDVDFLESLIDTLRGIPVMYGVDGYHIERLESLRKLLIEKGF